MYQISKFLMPWCLTRCLVVISSVVFLAGATPLPAARQNPKSRIDDKHKVEAKERVKDKVKDKVHEKAPMEIKDRIKERVHQRPDISARINHHWNRVSLDRRPFSAAWYKTHSYAWGYSYGVVRPWAPATFGSVARFVGISAPPVVFDYDIPAVVVTPNPWEDLIALVKAATPPPKAEDLMTLGVFSLLPPDATESSSMVQLNISSTGTLAGSYYDMLSDSGQPVAGSLDRNSQRVAWSIGTNKDVVFETGLPSLTSDETTVLVHYKDGTTQKWTMIRIAEESSAETAK